MWKPPISKNEADRLDALRRLDILLTTPEQPLDNVTRQLARIFDVPGAFISFIDEDTQYYKSEVGLPPLFAASRTEPRDMSLCSYLVGTNESLFVEDLTIDERFADNPAVKQFGVRFYAGTPLRAEGGHAVGSLCIIDQRPRNITPREQQMLDILAEGVMAQVQLQVASQQLAKRSRVIEDDLRRAIDVQRFLLPEPRVAGAGWTIEHVYRPVEHLGGDFVDVQRRPDGSWAVLLADVSGHGTTAALTSVMAKTSFMRAIASAESPGKVLAAMDLELSQVVPPGQFVTAQVLFLRPDRGEATIASAGHPYPLLMCKDFAEVVETHNGPPLLVQHDAHYPDMDLRKLHAGEAILLYTDGAIEAADDQQQHLRIEGLRSLAAQPRNAGESVVHTLLNAVLKHARSRLNDDVALLSAERCTR